MRLPRFVRGTRLRARDLEKVAGAAGREVRTGGGLVASRGGHGTRVALVRSNASPIVRLYVLAVHTPAPHPSLPGHLPLSVTYDLRAIDGSFDLVGVRPDHGCPVVGNTARIIPQAVKTRCFLVRHPKDDSDPSDKGYELWMDEKLAVEECVNG